MSASVGVGWELEPLRTSRASERRANPRGPRKMPKRSWLGGGLVAAGSVRAAGRRPCFTAGVPSPPRHGMLPSRALEPCRQHGCRGRRSASTTVVQPAHGLAVVDALPAASEAAAAAAAAPRLGACRRMLRTYEAALSTRPILTKSLTGGVLYGIGDATAQYITMSDEQRRSMLSHFDLSR